MTEPLTPTKFSAVKTVSGTNAKGPYSFQSVGFLTREYGDKKWYNFAFKGDCPLQEGKTYELEVKERPYKGKDGTDKVAYDAKFPNKETEMNKAIMRHEQEIGKIWAAIKELQPKYNFNVNAEIPIIDEDVPPPGDSDLPF